MVGAGAISGVAARIDPPKDGFAAANIVPKAAIKNEIEVKRICSKLDSIKHAMFKRWSPLAGRA